ncbi:MAG: hypothetical protein AMJ56_01685 [Anaerolineae bacterium SG8_19]|nr:MAG: hypothetical protein AMJ56_01685 [Anaerolineae bacterium SG8_19]
MFLIGLDIGTTGCKASLFSADGHLKASAGREYNVNMPHPDWAEQDADCVWQLAQDVLSQVLTTAGESKVAAIGLSVQGEAVTPVDEAGHPLRPMILGMDTRTVEQNKWLVKQFGKRELFEHTGMPVHTINTLPKLLWLKQNEPEIWQQAYRFLLYEDFIIHKMTGKAVISRCLASRTQLYDIQNRSWSPKLLAALELEPERLAEIVDSGTGVALMKSDLATDIGFAGRPLVVTGGHDQACGALGVGLTQPGLAMVSTGTAEVVELALDSPILDDTLFQGNISVYEHTLPGLYLAMTLNHSGGLLLRWYRDTFCIEEKQQAEAEDSDAYNLMLANAPDDPTGLLVLPHFAGSGTPAFDTTATGVILGLKFDTNKAKLAKALLEGLTYELKLNLDLLTDSGVVIKELRAIGGGAKSPLWLQLKADITGVKVMAPAVTEASGWGAALLAGYGVGAFADLAQAARTLTNFKQQFNPFHQKFERYQALYGIYKDLYSAAAPFNHRLNQVLN